VRSKDMTDRCGGYHKLLWCWTSSDHGVGLAQIVNKQTVVVQWPTCMR